MGKQGRFTYFHVLPCICLLLGVLILFFQAGSISSMWASHLQDLATSSLSTIPFFLRNFTLAAGNSTAGLTLFEIDAGPCTCLLQWPGLFDPNPLSAHHINCTCPTAPSSDDINSSMEYNPMEIRLLNNGTDLLYLNGTKASECAPYKVPEPEKIIVKEPCLPAQKIVKVFEETWYMKDRSWHFPSKFPRCTMDACINYTRCHGSSELLVYTYNQPAVPAKYFHSVNESKYNTNDPKKACLFFVFLDTPGLYRPELHPSKLPYWHGGLNHVLITFGDKWANKGPMPESIGYASTMATVTYETIYRPGFDVSIPLPAKRHLVKLRDIKPFARKYLMTFRGLRYLQGDGVLRSNADFRKMHNGKDIVVVTSCRHVNHNALRQDNATIDAECKRDEALYDAYNFADLMNSTFGLAPAGRQPSTYRFAEILSAGAVPVLVVDNYVKPFERLVQWHRCIIQFPSSEMRRIVSAVRAMKREEVERRQKYCLKVYSRWFASDEALLEASMEAQKNRFMGSFPSWASRSYLD